MTIFAVNRSMDEDMAFECDLGLFGASEIIEQIYMTHENIDAINTADAPNTVVPVNGGDAAVEGGVVRATLSKHSWNVIRVKL